MPRSQAASAKLLAAAAALLMLAACPGESAHRPPAAGPRAAPELPDLAKLRTLLAPHASLRFDANAQERGCPPDQNLGEYVAMLVHNGADGDEPGDIHRLVGGCVAARDIREHMAIDPPDDAAYWFCTIDAYTSDQAGDSPWHYELRLRVRKSDLAPDLATMACPGV